MRRRPGPFVLVAFAAVAIALVASTAITAARLRAVTTEARDIRVDAMPAVMELATLREHIHEILTALNQAVDRGDASGLDLEKLEAAVRQECTALDAHAHSFEEKTAWPATRRDVDDGLDEAEHVRALLAAGDVASARRELDGRLRPMASAAQGELWRLVESNALEGSRDAAAIDRVHEDATQLSYALAVACALFAALLGAGAAIAIRRHEASMEERARDLEQFAARVAHDLKGPLTPIVMSTQLAARKIPKDSPAQPLLAKAIDSSFRAVQLVEDLLAFARAGGAPDPDASSSVEDVARTTFEEISEAAAAKHIELSFEGKKDVKVACAKGVLSSLLSNLVRNAVKYMGDSAERRVVVRAEERSARAHVEVVDTGPGLPRGAEQRVFEPFVRADKTGQPGLGIGLATVKRLAEAHGGSVGVRTSSAGSTFWIDLPIAH